MSFFDDASLVLIPSGYKASKVYSVKPTDGTGDLTFTRSLDTATRVGPDGLIEKVRTNLVLQSQTFDNAGWAKSSTSIVANAETAPDGTLTAETMTIADGASRITQTLSLGAGTYTFSCFVKIISTTTAGDMRFAPTIDGVNTNAFFTPTSNYQRFSGTFTAATGVTTAVIRGATSGFVGTVAIWGFQVELSDFGPTSYIPTTTAAVSVGMLANVPRLDYLGGGCPHLLLEPQRTNLLTFSENLDNAAWTKTNSTISANVATSPAGFLEADKLVEDTSTGAHFLLRSLSLAAGVYNWGAFAKAAGRKFVTLRNNANGGSFFNTCFDVELGTIVFDGLGSAQIKSFGNGWFRITARSLETSATARNYEIHLSDAAVLNNSAISYTGDGTSGAFIYGAMAELGSFATSYIPTLGAAVTRSADAASKTGISALIGQTEGTLFVDFVFSRATNAFAYISVENASATSRLRITYTASTNTVQLDLVIAGSAFIIHTFNPVDGQRNKIAIAYKSGDSVGFRNGVQVGTQAATFTYTDISTFNFDNPSAAGTQIMSGGHNQALLFKTRLSNAQLAELTA